MNGHRLAVRVGVLLAAVLGPSAAWARYLSPEPRLQDPRWVARQAALGTSVAVYAYARNNPVRYVDPTGLDVQNNSSNGVWIVGEHGEQYYLAPGDTFYGRQDGLYSQNGIYKTNDGVNAVINPDGSTSMFGGSVLASTAQVYGLGLNGLPYPRFVTDPLGGPKDPAFLKRHPDWPSDPAANYPGGSVCGR